MKKTIFIGFLILILVPLALGQEKIETPLEYKVGDKWEWKWTRGREGHSWSNEIVEIKEDEIVAITGRGNKLFLDKQYNLLKTLNKKGEDITHNSWWEIRYWYKEFPMFIGKKWVQSKKIGFHDFRKGIRYEQDFEIEYTVEGFEEVKVPAGNFLAFKILFVGTTEDETGRGKVNPKVTLWYSPQVKNYIRGVWGDRYWLSEWQGVEFKLKKFEPGR